MEELLKWISAHYGMLILGLFREVFKDFAEAGKMPDGHLRGQAFPTELSKGVCWDEAQELS